MQFIVIEGNIGSGKTTLAKMLAADLNADLLLEQFADNPFLPRFYKDQKLYSFPLELSFLVERYSQIKNLAINKRVGQKLLVADYCFSKTSVFAQNTLSQDEYVLFSKIFNIFSESVPKPDLYVYLQTNTQNLLRNIKQRGREYEQQISSGYLENIEQGYLDYISSIDSFPVLLVDIRKIDFVKENHHFQRLKNIIFERTYELGINRLILA